MEAFLSWLFSTAGSGWVFGILSLIVLFVMRKKDFRPSRIVIDEKRRIEPIMIKNDMEGKISISFDGQEVEELGQLIINIYNEGNETITNPSITIQFSKDIKILNSELIDTDSGTVKAEGNKVTINFEFLNSYTEHHQVEQLSLITNGAPDKIKINGSGEGWSIRHVALPSTEQVNKNAKVFLYGMALLMFTMLAYGAWLDYTYDIPMHEVSARAFIAYLPVIVLLVGWMVYGYQKLLKRI